MRFLYTVFIALALSQTAHAGVVDVSAVAKPQKITRSGSFQVVLDVAIKQGYHIGANYPSVDIPAEIKMQPISGVTYNKPVYPKPLMKTFQFSSEKLPVYEGKTRITLKGIVAKNAPLGTVALKGNFSYQACDNSSCLMPEKLPFTAKIKVIQAKRVAMAPASLSKPSSTILSSNKGNIVADLLQSKGLPLTLLWIFIAGIGLTFTPCVFPMIPIIVGWFGIQGAGNKGKVGAMAGLFVLGLALTYAMLGLSASKAGGMLGSILQHPTALIAIATVFVILALSMFGIFELRPPAFIANKSRGKEGIFGMLLMGALFGIVAAPCAGPVVAALLVYAGQIGKPIVGFWMLFTLALGLGLPFFMLAVFSGALAALPKSGIWMVEIKKVFGIILLYFAIKYINPILPTKTAEYAFAAFFISAGIYFGWIKQSATRVNWLLIAFGVVVAVVGAGSVLFNISAEAPKPGSPQEHVRFIPYSIQVIQQAKTAEKPVILDFSAAWCKPCKELDKRTFKDAAVVAEGRRFVWVKADLTKAGTPEIETLQMDYSIKGVPTVILIDSHGNEQDRIIGFIGPRVFLEKIKAVN